MYLDPIGSFWEEMQTQTCTERRPREDRGEHGFYKPRTEASGGTCLRPAWIWDSQPPGQSEDQRLGPSWVMLSYSSFRKLTQRRVLFFNDLYKLSCSFLHPLYGYFNWRKAIIVPCGHNRDFGKTWLERQAGGLEDIFHSMRTLLSV